MGFQKSPPKNQTIMKNQNFIFVLETFLGHPGGVGWLYLCEVRFQWSLFPQVAISGVRFQVVSKAKSRAWNAELHWSSPTQFLFWLRLKKTELMRVRSRLFSTTVQRRMVRYRPAID